MNTLLKLARNGSTFFSSYQDTVPRPRLNRISQSVKEFPDLTILKKIATFSSTFIYRVSFKLLCERIQSTSLSKVAGEQPRAFLISLGDSRHSSRRCEPRGARRVIVVRSRGRQRWMRRRIVNIKSNSFCDGMAISTRKSTGYCYNKDISTRTRDVNEGL